MGSHKASLQELQNSRYQLAAGIAVKKIITGLGHWIPVSVQEALCYIRPVADSQLLHIYQNQCLRTLLLFLLFTHIPFPGSKIHWMQQDLFLICHA